MSSSSGVLIRGSLQAAFKPRHSASNPRTFEHSYICRRCLSQYPRASCSTTKPSQPPPEPPVDETPDLIRHASSPSPAQPDLHTIFTRPTWSVRSLLPSSRPPSPSPSSSPSPSPLQAQEEEEDITKTTTITPSTLHHLLRLSALPPPSSPQEEQSMLATLRTQLRFVRDIQSVDTDGVEPLRAIRDETSAGVAQSAVTLDTLRDALGRETTVGRRGRPRRVRGLGVGVGVGESQQRDGERSAEEMLVEKATRARREKGYFVVESGKREDGADRWSE